jgi:hypothetical protein
VSRPRQSLRVCRTAIQQNARSEQCAACENLNQAGFSHQ